MCLITSIICVAVDRRPLFAARAVRAPQVPQDAHAARVVGLVDTSFPLRPPTRGQATEKLGTRNASLCQNAAPKIDLADSLGVAWPRDDGQAMSIQAYESRSFTLSLKVKSTVPRYYSTAP